MDKKLLKYFKSFFINQFTKLKKRSEKLWNAHVISSKASAEFFKNFSIPNVYNFMLFINRNPNLEVMFLINKFTKMEKKFEKLWNAQVISSKGSAEFFKNFSVPIMSIISCFSSTGIQIMFLINKSKNWKRSLKNSGMLS